MYLGEWNPIVSVDVDAFQLGLCITTQSLPYFLVSIIPLTKCSVYVVILSQHRQFLLTLKNLSNFFPYASSIDNWLRTYAIVIIYGNT